MEGQTELAKEKAVWRLVLDTVRQMAANETEVQKMRKYEYNSKFKRGS